VVTGKIKVLNHDCKGLNNDHDFELEKKSRFRQ